MPLQYDDGKMNKRHDGGHYLSQNSYVNNVIHPTNTTANCFQWQLKPLVPAPSESCTPHSIIIIKHPITNVVIATMLSNKNGPESCQGAEEHSLSEVSQYNHPGDINPHLEVLKWN